MFSLVEQKWRAKLLEKLSEHFGTRFQGVANPSLFLSPASSGPDSCSPREFVGGTCIEDIPPGWHRLAFATCMITTTLFQPDVLLNRHNFEILMEDTGGQLLSVIVAEISADPAKRNGSLECACVYLVNADGTEFDPCIPWMELYRSFQIQVALLISPPPSKTVSSCVADRCQSCGL